MKKVSIFIAAILAAAGLGAQNTLDTIEIGQREPTFYYSDTIWYDTFLPHDSEGYWVARNTSYNRCKPERARYCHVEDTTRVIGIAAPICFIKNVPEWSDDREFFKDMATEYFRIYEIDTADDSLVMLAQGSWNSWTVTREMNVTQYEPAEHRAYSALYEVYFDSAVTVYDSFYVSFTGYNNYLHEKPMFNAFVYVRGVMTSPAEDGYVVSDLPYPRHMRLKLHYIGGLDDYDYIHGITDTNWHVISSMSGLPGYSTTGMPIKNFYNIYPIIDTSAGGTMGHPDSDTCARPTGLSVVSVDSNGVALTWNSGIMQHWELSLCPDGCVPDSGSIIQCGSPLATLTGLDSNTVYAVWVRSVCYNNMVSAWSDSVHVFIQGDSIPTRVPTMADIYTLVSPNPATDRVEVFSSYRMGAIEIYTIDGRMVSRHRADGIHTELDISPLSSGTYLLRIETNHGVTVKKLVKK